MQSIRIENRGSHLTLATIVRNTESQETELLFRVDPFTAVQVEPTAQFTLLREGQVGASKESVPAIREPQDHATRWLFRKRIERGVVSVQDVLGMLRGVKTSQAAGPDEVPMAVLVAACQACPDALVRLAHAVMALARHLAGGGCATAVEGA